VPSSQPSLAKVTLLELAVRCTSRVPPAISYTVMTVVDWSAVVAWRSFVMTTPVVVREVARLLCDFWDGLAP
jgi:hypothetical protein